MQSKKPPATKLPVTPEHNSEGVGYYGTLTMEEH